MSRVNSADGQEIVFEDINKISSLLQREIYDRVIKEMLQRQINGFFEDSFIASYVSATSVSINKGLGFHEDLTVAAEEPSYRPLFQAANVNQTLDPPDLVNDRIDIITVQHNLADGVTDTRKFKNASTSVITNESFVVTKEWSVTYNIVAGTPSGSPAVPATPAGEIKICELLVSAVTGLSGAGAVTDTRSLLPIGGNMTVNTAGATRITSGSAVLLSQLMGEIDAFLVSGLQEYTDFVDQITDPSVPAASRLRVYNKGGIMFIRENGGTVTPIGSGGGGGGGGANWVGDALEAEEFSENVRQFAEGDTQKLTLYLKVPQGYLAGRQVQMFLGLYSPDTADDVNMQTVTSLVRAGQDAVDSNTNQHTADTGDLTLTAPANEYFEGTVDLSDATGQVNGFAISPGDLLRVELTREAPAGTDATSDVRFIPSSTEVKFG